ncbi:MAG: DUF1214 domain-containing protein [Erythrobacter sp.]
MIARLARYSFALAIGAALGIASALYLAGLWPGMKPVDFGDIEVDGWRSDFAIGSEAADMYTRARVARHGLLALAKSEAVYFTRTTDGEGAPLREACTYRLTVGKMPAGWWSVTLYDGDSLLPMNEDEALSANQEQETGGEGLVATIAAEKPESGAWISSRNAGSFDLTLRLYVPDEALLADPEATLKPPTVERLSCAGDTP